MAERTIKVLSVFGTRPETTKMAPVVKALMNHPLFTSKVLVTAQHREMLDQAMSDFEIKSDYDLNVMKENQTLAETTQRVLERLTPILEQERPDMVLVHGDTATTASAALASYYLKVPCGHVEAGLRTGDKYAPFPEEMMRKIADAISDLHFAPTVWAKENLLKEGQRESSIFVTGNTAVDAVLLTARDHYVFRNQILRKMLFDDDSDTSGLKRIVVELHRRENFGQGMENLGRALSRIAREREDVRLLVSVHRNPNAGEPIRRHLAGCKRAILFDPLDYPDYINLMKRSYLVITDSGGVQEEAPSLQVPVVLCREKTERPEAIRSGTVVLVGTDENLLTGNVYELLDDPKKYGAMAKKQNPFGDGKAADRIVKALLYYFGLESQRPCDFES